MGKVVSSVFGGGGGGPSVTTDPTAQEAFRIVKPGLEYSTTAGIDLAKSIMADPAYGGPRVAALNPFQTQSANYLGNFANEFTPRATNAVSNVGFSNVGAGANVGGNAQTIFDRSSVDPTQQILFNANQYANNPYVDGLIDASARDVTRNLYENELTGAGLRASGTGNTNSTRAGVESAILQRGAADRLADLSSQIRSQFFGQGLGMSQNQFNQNLTNMMQANAGLQGASEFGSNMLGTAQNIAQTGFGQGQLAGGVLQAQEQAQLDAAKNSYDEALANRLAVLQNLNGNTGAGKGFSSVAGVTQQPSMATQLGGLALGAASAAKTFGFSDIRMKENIEYVGQTPAGLNVYDFEYKPEFKDIAGHGRFRGVMADEAEKLFPDAVSIASNGFKQVNYSLVE